MLAGALGNSTTWCYFALLRVTGEGVATVEQLDKDKDVFAGAVVERLTFSFMSLCVQAAPVQYLNNVIPESNCSMSNVVIGKAVALTLCRRGGRNQLFVGNNNTDQGFIKVTDCTFAYASGAAIKIVGPSCQGCPAGVDNCPSDPHCPPNPHPQTGSYSSQVIIKDCVFSRNYQVLIVWSDEPPESGTTCNYAVLFNLLYDRPTLSRSDWAVFKDSWISSSCDLTDGAIIENVKRIATLGASLY